MQPHLETRAKADCFNQTDIKAGDYFYMCSDGMLEQMEDRELVNILSLSQSDSKKISILKGATKDNRDNHSAHLIHVLSTGGNTRETADDALPAKRSALNRPGLKVLVFIVIIAVLAAMLFFLTR